MKTALACTLKRLGTDYVDLYRPARLDPNVPIEDMVGAIAEMVKAGYVRYSGLSEVGAATIPGRPAVHPIADLQIEYSLISRGIEDSILAACRALGVGITAHGVLSRGLISGPFDCFGLGFRATCFDGDLHGTFHRIFEGHLDSEQSVLVCRFGFVRFHRPT